ncbi:ATP-dependent RNA helicase SrmB [Thorsellia anophelis]|uniref:ATP-dependent RNA helicase SrmB n=1 Tax=Thorsellia anophelis DSM 18579 TaxID=1123402 RepID=A0A1I0BL46_9GAMM|nr:ATP-dependent RNA helicase SrmB [Thorsellia anophelis]SET07662.1 ATP-dependent RNA helicase SrmB [Thorsellia anophelis DSM 18579]
MSKNSDIPLNTVTLPSRTANAKRLSIKKFKLANQTSIDEQKLDIGLLTEEHQDTQFEEPTLNSFDELSLDDRLLTGLSQKGLHKPTSIQSIAIPATLAGHDVLGSAPTGTGKSLAFLLPAMQHLLDFPRKNGGPPRVLILTPTRELAHQIAEQAKEISGATHLAITTITGGVSYVNHAEIFSTNQDIVVATTGRLLQYIREENFDCRAIEILILDEADRLLDMGFAQDVETIAAETRWRKQTLLYSATLEGNDVEEFAKRVLTDPVILQAQSSRKERKKIVQYYYRADDYAHKLALLTHILGQEGVDKIVIFVRKKEKVHQLSKELQSAGIPNSYLEGDLAQHKRQEAIKRLNNGKVKVLIATDVAARGIDIPDVTHVINFDMARTADVFLHRIGRTARAGKKGIAISLVEAHDFLLLNKAERYLGEEIPYRVIDTLRPKSKKPNLKHSGRPSKKTKKVKEEKKKANKKKGNRASKNKK